MERNTRQRGAIRRAFLQANRPLGTGEVLDVARQEVAGLGIATVYRNIRALVDEGWLVTVALPDEPPRYELQGKEHHHHFRCRGCARVFDVRTCASGIAEMLPSGFRLEAHDILLQGLCPECASSP